MFIVAEIISKLFKCVISHATVVIGYSLFEIRDWNNFKIILK